MGGKYAVYPEYKGSGIEVIGDVPKDWMVGRLKQVVDQNRPITYGIVQAGPNKKGGIPYIRPADMTEEGGVKSHDDLLRTSPEIATDYERSKIKPGDIICSIGPSFGKLMITPESLDGANLTQGTARVAISPAYNSRYFFWALRATSSFQQWESSVGGATFRALNLGPLADTFVVVPTESEKEKIVNFLDHETAKIDTLIEKQQQLIKLLKEKRQAVISHAVTKGLDPNTPMRDSGVEWLGEVPEHWALKNYRYATQIYRGKFGHRPRNDPAFYDGNYPFIQTGDVAQARKKITKYKQTLNERGISVSQKFPSGTLVMAIAANIGDTAILDFEAYAPDSVVGFKPNEDVDLEFLRYSLMAALPALEQTSTQSTQANLNIDRIGTVKATFPSRKEQLEIVAKLDALHEKYANIEIKALEAIELMQERRTALISAAVTGKIDVRNWQAPEPLDNQNKDVAA